MPYLFNRSTRLAPGNLLDSMGWAAKMTEKVNAVADIQVALWAPVLSPQINTLSWISVVNDVSEMTVTDEKLMADSGYLDLVEEGSRFSAGTGIDDSLVNLIHADPDGFETAQYASITTAVLAPGKSAEGIELGVETAARVKAITGRPTSFGASVTGPYGEVGWISLADSIDQVQQMGEALAADADWVALIDKKASKAYAAEAATRRITRKLA